jgi:hypothetical protein
LQDLYKAFGQYLIYHSGLEEIDPERKLFLAMPEEVLMKDFNHDIFVGLLKKYHINVLLFSISEERLKGKMP